MSLDTFILPRYGARPDRLWISRGYLGQGEGLAPRRRSVSSGVAGPRQGCCASLRDGASAALDPAQPPEEISAYEEQASDLVAVRGGRLPSGGQVRGLRSRPRQTVVRPGRP